MAKLHTALLTGGKYVRNKGVLSPYSLLTSSKPFLEQGLELRSLECRKVSARHWVMKFLTKMFLHVDCRDSSQEALQRETLSPTPHIPIYNPNISATEFLKT